MTKTATIQLSTTKPKTAGYIFVEVDWDLTSDDCPTPSMKQAGVAKYIGIPASEFCERYDEAPEEWVADYLSDETGWLVNGWCFV